MPSLPFMNTRPVEASLPSIIVSKNFDDPGDDSNGKSGSHKPNDAPNAESDGTRAKVISVSFHLNDDMLTHDVVRENIAPA
jgi:hypothetical protein